MPTSAHAERLRLAALRAYQVLDEEPAPELQGLVALAAHLTGAPVAALTLLDAEHLRQVAAYGAPRTDVPAADALCRVTVDERRTLHTADAGRDPRWSGNVFCQGTDGVRLYASAPLLDPEGNALGTLCVFDQESRSLTAEQLGALGLLADQAVALFESSRRARRLVEVVEELDRLAHLDPLTGLVNRAAATRALERQCGRGGWALLFLDVDDFKAVNDLAGHQAGDAALREVAARLRSGLRPHDLLARWSGDEFVALLHDVQDAAALAEVVDRLHDEVGRPFRLEGWNVELSVSIGGALVPADGSPQEVLRQADVAMYAAKRQRRRLLEAAVPV